jgi:hypothetical protein
MFTTAGRDAALATVGGYVGLIKAITDWRAGTVTEAAYTGYGTRPAFGAGAAADTTPTGGRQVGNAGIISWPENTGANEDQIAWGLWTAATAGTLRQIGLLDTDPPVLGVGNGDDTIDAYAHGFETDQRVFVQAAPGAVIPTGLSENVAYFVLAAGLTADVFSLSLTSGGAAVNITVGGAAQFMPYKVRTVAGGATPTAAIGTIVVQM